MTFFMTFFVLMLAGCEIESTTTQDFFAPGYDLVRIQKLYPTAWETSYHVITPNRIVYFNKTRYDLASPITPTKVQSYLKGLRAWSGQVYTFLVTLMNHDPILTYQAGDWNSRLSLQSQFSTPKDRSTWSFLSRLSSSGFIRFYDVQKNPLDVLFQMTSPMARFTMPNPLMEVQAPVGELGATGANASTANVPDVDLMLFSSEAWKNAQRHLPQPGFVLKGRVGIQKEVDEIRVNGKELRAMSTVRLGNANHYVSLGSEPGASYRFSSSGKSGLYDAKLTLATEATESIAVPNTGFRLDQLRLRGKYFSILPSAFLSELGITGSWVHVPSKQTMRVDWVNKLWMKKDPQTNTFLKMRNLLSGSLAGQWPGIPASTSSLDVTRFTIPAFELYFDAGDTFKNGIPENIQILLSVRGAAFQFGETRTTPTGGVRKPISLTLRFRALLNLNLANTTLYSRDNVLMASVDWLSFEGDLPQATVDVQTVLYAIPIPGQNDPLGRLLFRHMQKEHGREMYMPSESALDRLNQEGDVPELVRVLREQISLLRVEKFDEQVWQKVYSRAARMQQDFERSASP